MDKVVFTSSSELNSLIKSAVTSAFKEQQENDNKSEKQFLTIKEASSYLNIAKQTIYGYTSQNKIPHIKKGKKLYFLKGDLDNWITSGKREF